MLKLLSLFSGIGAFEKALDNLKVDYNLVGYCEFDKYASESYSAIHGIDKRLNLGDITKVNIAELEQGCADIITYGFPCQDISNAGKQKGFEDENGNLTRSGLFFYATAIIGRIQPKIAICENVKALTGKKFEKEFGIVLNTLNEMGYNNYWQVLNAKDYGIPQNRERVFIVSIRKDVDTGLFEFPKPIPLTLKLGDLLEKEVDEKYYLSERAIQGRANTKFNQYKLESRIIDENGVHPTILARYEGAPTLVDETKSELKTKLCKELLDNGLVEEGDVIRHSYTNNRLNNGVKNMSRTECKEKLSPTLDTRCDCLGVVVKESQPIVIDDTYGFDDEPRIYEDCPTIRASRQGLKVCTPMDLRIRKLTPKECWRLMGFDDEDVEKAAKVCSNSQLYKQAGNSIVVDVLEELFCMMLDTDGNLYI